MDYRGYAIWWVPRVGSALARFGADWTGWCADRGVTTPTPALAAMSRPRAGVPGALARYGLHATVGPAFRLAEGHSAWALEDALAAVAERTLAIRMPRFEPTVLDGRVVLVPARPDEAVTRLVTDVAEAIRAFRVPVRPAAVGAGGGIALPGRREGGAAGGTDGGADGGAVAMPALDRFHIRLSDRLELGTAHEVVAELEAMLAPVLERSQVLTDLALVGDPGGGRPWRLLDRYELTGEKARTRPTLPDGMDFLGPSLMAPLGTRRAA